MTVSPSAGKTADAAMLVDVPRLVSAYYTEAPDPSVPGQRVAFGTSGHRGSAFARSFNEGHILAITQAICLYRARKGIDGPLFLGMDTHALSVPALASAMEVLAANGVDVLLATGDEYTPTPVVSHAILTHNRGRDRGLADGIVITPSHNPPEDGGFKYNPPNGGPAESAVTTWIEAKANELLEQGLAGLKRIPFEQALRRSTTHRHDFLNTYVADLANVIDMDVIRDAKIHLGADPLGGAGVHYWGPIAERYGLDLTVVSDEVDPTFRFMTVDWDGRRGPAAGRASRGSNSVTAITPLVGQILVDSEARQDRGDVAELHLFYNRPTGGAGYAPVRQRLLPLDEEWRRALAEGPWPTKSLPEIMGGGSGTLRALIREYLFVSLFRACAESLASENASRLASMQRADKNIDELLVDLKGSFHRQRQSGIDEELFDVVSGFEALGGEEA